MNTQNLTKANHGRTLTAAARTVDEAWAALEIIDTVPAPNYRAMKATPRYRLVLRARVEHPDKSLSAIAETLFITKHTYSAALRRAIAYAARIHAAETAGDA